jgi:type II secretory pathway pseudopilin PulG
MGKYSLVITLGIMSVVSLIALQGQQMSMDTQDRQSRREGQVIARQIARSGHNAVLAEARAHTDPGDDVSSIVSDVGTITGSYEGGNYRAWLEKISPTAYKAIAEGKKVVAGRVVKHKLGDNYADNTMVKAPTVTQPSVLKAEFKESMAGYCSAIYLQRFVPKTNNGHGNNCDGVDSSNPGQSHQGEDTNPNVDDECGGGGAYPSNGSGSGSSKGAYRELEPELVFAPGNDRNGVSTTFEKTIQPGTKLNFILAVDADYTCEMRGDTTLAANSDFYDYTRESFSQDESDLEKIKEKPYAMIEETSEGYRVAFEDLVFDEKKLWDIKENGYPGSTSWDAQDETYGGDGWEKNGDGLNDLEDYGNIPDFSDQVLQMTLESPTEDEAEDGEVADG